jgi:hypothetical protein
MIFIPTIQWQYSLAATCGESIAPCGQLPHSAMR